MHFRSAPRCCGGVKRGGPHAIGTVTDVNYPFCIADKKSRDSRWEERTRESTRMGFPALFRLNHGSTRLTSSRIRSRGTRACALAKAGFAIRIHVCNVRGIKAFRLHSNNLETNNELSSLLGMLLPESPQRTTAARISLSFCFRDVPLFSPRFHDSTLIRSAPFHGKWFPFDDFAR